MEVYTHSQLLAVNQSPVTETGYSDSSLVNLRVFRVIIGSPMTRSFLGGLLLAVHSSRVTDRMSVVWIDVVGVLVTTRVTSGHD